jgi:predicted Ser/Thr protein kinase
MVHVCPECGEATAEAGVCGKDRTPRARTTDPLLGRSIGNWRVTTLIGRGGMGRVYRAVQPNIGARVAIKVLAGDRACDAGALERFVAEARATSLARHENIVNVLDVRVLEDGAPCIVMEYLDGEPLSAIVARGCLPPCEVARLALEVLAALANAHAKGVVHRDLKPENVFITPEGHVKVLDFGVAKLTGSANLTQSGTFLGTPAYLSPEQVREAKHLDGRADLYSLGVLMFEALTGRLPFEAESTFDLLRAHVEAKVPDVRALRPDVPDVLAAIVARALAKDPASRYADAETMARALSAALPALPPAPRAIPARPVLTTATATTCAGQAELRPRARRRLARWPFAAASLLALAIIPFAVRARTHRAPPVDGDASYEVFQAPSPQSFDPSAFYARAEEKARRAVPDAQLVRFNCQGVGTDGRVALAYGQRACDYTFVGTRRDVGDAVVAVRAEERVSSVGWGRPYLKLTPVPAPRCTMAAIIARAGVKGPMQVSYQANHGYAQWLIVQHGGGQAILHDDCP